MRQGIENLIIKNQIKATAVSHEVEHELLSVCVFTQKIALK